MPQVYPLPVADKPRLQSSGEARWRSSTPKPRIKAVLADGRCLTFIGREAWTLNELLKTGARGCTPIDNPGPRWSHYIHRLRRAGLMIETVHEAHGGPYAGHHARYVLRSQVRVLENSFDARNVGAGA